jgi:hypothetical protein
VSRIARAQRQLARPPARPERSERSRRRRIEQTLALAWTVSGKGGGGGGGGAQSFAFRASSRSARR